MQLLAWPCGITWNSNLGETGRPSIWIVNKTPVQKGSPHRWNRLSRAMRSNSHDLLFIQTQLFLGVLFVIFLSPEGHPRPKSCGAGDSSCWCRGGRWHSGTGSLHSPKTEKWTGCWTIQIGVTKTKHQKNQIYWTTMENMVLVTTLYRSNCGNCCYSTSSEDDFDFFEVIPADELDLCGP